jgi:hypothetical protein
MVPSASVVIAANPSARLRDFFTRRNEETKGTVAARVERPAALFHAPVIHMRYVRAMSGRTARASLLVVAFVALTGCKSGGGGDDAYKKDVQTMCDGPSLTRKEAPGILEGKQMDLGQKARLIVNVVDPKVTTADGKTFWKSLLSEMLSGKQKGQKLAAEATRLGISKCEMADFWAQ